MQIELAHPLSFHSIQMKMIMKNLQNELNVEWLPHSWHIRTPVQTITLLCFNWKRKYVSFCQLHITHSIVILKMYNFIDKTFKLFLLLLLI